MLPGEHILILGLKPVAFSESSTQNGQTLTLCPEDRMTHYSIRRTVAVALAMPLVALTPARWLWTGGRSVGLQSSFSLCFRWRNRGVKAPQSQNEARGPQAGTTWKDPCPVGAWLRPCLVGLCYYTRRCFHPRLLFGLEHAILLFLQRASG